MLVKARRRGSGQVRKNGVDIGEERVRVYRSSGQLVAVVVVGVMINLLWVLQIIRDAERHFNLALMVIGIAIVDIVFVRFAFTSLVAGHDSVRVRNFWTSFTVRWDEITNFDIGRSGLLWSVCRIHTKTGRVRRAVGIQEGRTKSGGAAGITEELNKELSERTATT